MAYDTLLNYPGDWRTPSPIGTVYNLFNIDLRYISQSAAERDKSTLRITIKSDNETRVIYGSDLGVVEIGGGWYWDISSQTVTIPEGETEITYQFNGSLGWQTIRFYVYGEKMVASTKTWTNRAVIERILRLAKPLRRGEAPQFSLSISIDDELNSVLDEIAPEYTMTRMNLREALQMVGGVLHAEPRLYLDVNSEAYEGYFVYDKWGKRTLATVVKGTETIPLNQYQYITHIENQELEQACTKLDSYIDNLVNRVSWKNATISKPSSNLPYGATLRSESAYVRLEENSGTVFTTEFPIDRIDKFEVVYRKWKNGAYTTISKDIAQYVYESKVYANLSSFTARYPSSKSYALFYTQGGKNIDGFFYKVPNATGGVGVNYSIVNILKAVGVPKSIYDDQDYYTIEFRISYVPIYSTRIQHGKQYLSDYLCADRITNYAQGDNSVETRYYGENIKGMAQRLGNIEKYVTFHLRDHLNIPSPGELWDSEYYISTVQISVLQDNYGVTCGLSKHFNRKSKYIGASSIRRIFEVSETMVQQRQTFLCDYIVFETEETALSNSQYTAETTFGELYLSADGFSSYMLVLDGASKDALLKAQSIVFKGYYRESENSEPLAITSYNIDLPCIASAFGNTIEFTASCKDNFSAGVEVEKIDRLIDENAGEIKGMFTRDIEYADYYGKAYYIGFSLVVDKDETAGSQSSVESTFKASAKAFPKTTRESFGTVHAGTFNGKYLHYEKDNRETLKLTYAVEAVAGDSSFVLGTGLTSENPLITNERQTQKPHLFVLKNEIGMLDNFYDNLTSSNIVADLGEFDNVQKSINGFYLTSPGKTSSVAGKAWVVAYPYYNGETYLVASETGGDEPYTPKLGGEILVGRNVNISAGDTVGNFKAYAVHDLQAYIRKRRKLGTLEL